MAKPTAKKPARGGKHPSGERRKASSVMNVITIIEKAPMYVPPSFRPAYCSYPPYCRDLSQTIDEWRVQKLRVEVEVSTDKLQTIVEGWVNQLVRG